MNNSLIKAAAVFAFATVALTAQAGQKDAKALPQNTGEVKAVDVAARNITLRHGPIKSKTVEMDPMTMMFPVKNPALLAKVKVGDNVKFVAENIDGEATLTSLVVQKGGSAR